jgi:hypothetical protein
VCYTSKKRAGNDSRDFGLCVKCQANFMEAAAFERTYGTNGRLKPRRVNPKDGFRMK